MTQVTTFRAFGEILSNPVGLEFDIVAGTCDGLNIALASFQALYLQYQKHHFVVDGAEFYELHEFFEESYKSVTEHVHEIGERLNGLGGTPAASFTKLASLSAFEPETDGVFAARQMVEHNLAAEQAIIDLIRRQAAQTESVGDRATRFLYEKILTDTEERAFHLEHFLASDSLTLSFVQPAR